MDISDAVSSGLKRRENFQHVITGFLQDFLSSNLRLFNIKLDGGNLGIRLN